MRFLRHMRLFHLPLCASYTDFRCRYNVKVFRHTIDADKAVKSRTGVHSGKQMMENTATVANGRANDYDRKAAEQRLLIGNVLPRSIH